jgi:hypothetical protein
MTDDAAAFAVHGVAPAIRTEGIRLRRLRLATADRTYDIDFRRPDGSVRALSVIAGAFSTGKTAVLEFIDYCLGAVDHPRHPEVMPRVRTAALEVDLSGATHVIERTVGRPSAWASVWPGGLDGRGLDGHGLDGHGAVVTRCPIQPAGQPGSLSSLLLSYCKLEGVHVREMLEGPADPLSFRELMWLCLLSGDRIDGDLLFEREPDRNLMLRQVVDVVFDMHDDHSVRLGRQLRELEERAHTAQLAYAAARDLVEEQGLGDPGLLAAAVDRAGTEQASVAAALADLESRILATTEFAANLRERHQAAVAASEQALLARRDGETQLRRMVSLRAQYAEDVSKLTMLAEAEEIFEPLRVTACPVCQTVPSMAAAIVGGRCGLCQAVVPADTEMMTIDVAMELKAAQGRLAEITRWIEELEDGLPALQREAERAQAAQAEAAAQVDAATGAAIAPFLGERDALARRREAAALADERAAAGLRLIASLQRRASAIESHQAAIASLREELGEAEGSPPDRSPAIGRISHRFAQILADWRYPKLTEAYVDERLVPHVRGQRYRAASPGGRTLIALAWQLAVFEVAWETGSSHPGFLLIDSPQRNVSDSPLADAATIARVYRHLRLWLHGAGAGAQVIVADNAPPAEADDHVIVRFTRRPDQPPYGLIDDQTE